MVERTKSERVNNLVNNMIRDDRGDVVLYVWHLNIHKEYPSIPSRNGSVWGVDFFLIARIEGASHNACVMAAKDVEKMKIYLASDQGEAMLSDLEAYQQRVQEAQVEHGVIGAEVGPGQQV